MSPPCSPGCMSTGPALDREAYTPTSSPTRSCGRATRCSPSGRTSDACTTPSAAAWPSSASSAPTRLHTLDRDRVPRSRAGAGGGARARPGLARERVHGPRAEDAVGFGAKRFTRHRRRHQLGQAPRRRAARGWHLVRRRRPRDRDPSGRGPRRDRRLGPEPMDRTREAIAAHGRGVGAAGATAIAAVGTAGLRAATNGAEFVSAVESRCGVRIEIIPGDEEARLAYLAAKAGLGLPRRGRRLRHRRRQLPVHLRPSATWSRSSSACRSARCRLTERHGLDRRRLRGDAARRLDDIATELDRLDGRPPTDALVGMGGALTNLAAVKLALAEYDPDAVQGTRLDEPRSIGRSSSTALGRPTSGDRSSACSRTGRRSSSRAPASCARC